MTALRRDEVPAARLHGARDPRVGTSVVVAGLQDVLVAVEATGICGSDVAAEG